MRTQYFIVQPVQVFVAGRDIGLTLDHNPDF